MERRVTLRTSVSGSSRERVPPALRLRCARDRLRRRHHFQEEECLRTLIVVEERTVSAGIERRLQHEIGGCLRERCRRRDAERAGLMCGAGGLPSRR